MQAIIILLILTTILFISARIVTRSIFGPILSDETWVPILEIQIKKGSKLNYYDSSIIRIGNLPSISNVPFDIISYYHIENVGVIPRGSKTHKLIKAEFEKLKKEQLNKYLK
jgi:hypothetical protein